MARSKSTEVAKPSSTAVIKRTNISDIDKQLLSEVDTIKQNIGAPATNKIALDNKNSCFILPNGTNPTEITVVVIDFIGANRYYTRPYNQDNPVPPDCYAFSGSQGTPGVSLLEMVPFDDSPSVQSDACASCPQNVFGTGINGTSKACKNTRDLVVMLIPEGDEPADENLYIVQIPPSGLKSFDSYISSAQKLFGHPIKSVITMQAVNKGQYSSIAFVDPEPNEAYAEHFARREDAQQMLFRRPDFSKLAAPPARSAVAKKATPARNPAAPRR